jgi:sugar-specific transcriptional regulator TrmB
LGDETVKKILKDFGLTEKEVEPYIFLAKHGALKGSEIVNGIKMPKGEVYRHLKNLQSKGIVESTLEAPTRFTAVPFEKVLESFIRIKKEEVTSIENSKQELLSDWQSINKTGVEFLREKFVVIEGNRRIYPKILQMIQETKSDLSAVSSVEGLLRADQYGLFDAILENPLKSKIQFRFLTELSRQNTVAAKTLLKKMPRKGVDLKGRNPDLALPLPSRMILRDGEEILLFITPKDTSTSDQNEVCLWTTCKELIQSFTGVFEELWRNSTEIEKKIIEIEIGKPTPKTTVINEAKTAKKKYDEILSSARKQIIIMTSSKGLLVLSKNMPFLKRLSDRGVSIKIMASIVAENLEAAQQLMNQYEIRHVPAVYLGATTVDSTHFFEFKSISPDQEDSDISDNFENTFYTNDFEYVQKTENMLKDIWVNAQIPSRIALRDIIQLPLSKDKPATADIFAEYRKEYKKIVGFAYRMEPQQGRITEKEILDKIANAVRVPAKDPERDTIRFYGTLGIAIIYPPKHLNLPTFMIHVNHYNKNSSFGAGSSLSINMQTEIAGQQAYLPTSFVTNNPRGFKFRKAMQARHHSTQIIQLLKKDELKVHFQGDRLFAGWTVPIPLLPQKYILSPGCLTIEGYGEVKTYTSELKGPMNRRVSYDFTSLDAFVTFMYQSSKYNGPGSDAVLYRDTITTSRPPSAWKETDSSIQ